MCAVLAMALQKKGHEASALMEFKVRDATAGDGMAGEAPPLDAFTIELSKTELQGLLEKLDRVQAQLDALAPK
jgi:hypothetical protein